MYTGTCGPHLILFFQTRPFIIALNPIAEKKQQIRQRALEARRRLSVEHRHQCSAAVVNNIIHSALWRQAEHVGIYLAINAEVDLNALSQEDKKLYIPATQGTDMQFHRFNAQTQLHPGPFQISQPKFQAQHAAPPLDLCLLPLVAFDHNGNRLGMGGGFYDRYFADNKHVILAGVAFSIQQQAQLPVEDWDVKLQHIFTEQEHISL